MKTIRKRVFAVCMAALLLIPGLPVSAEEASGAENVNEVENTAAVSGGDAAMETVDAGDVEAAAEILVNDQVVVYADDNIASGVDGDITWVIDASGKLMVSGVGDLLGYRAGEDLVWIAYGSQITSAVINVTGMTDASYLFEQCYNMTSIDLSGFDTRNVTDMGNMFDGCSGLTSLDVSGFDTCNVTDMMYMFRGCSSLTSLDVSSFETRNVVSMEGMFSGCSGLTNLDVSGFDTSNVTAMLGMFEGCSGLTSLDVSGFDTSNVTGMWGMFSGCSGLTSLDVSGFDTSNVIEMGEMFSDCSGLTNIDVSVFDTSNVTGMRWMFFGCSSLTSLDVSGFDTSNVRDMWCMFAWCSSLSNLDVSGFDTSNVELMLRMFAGCSSLSSIDVSGFNTSNVAIIFGMFSNCSSLSSIDVSGFNTSNVTSLWHMFYNCSNLTSLDMSKLDTSNVTDMREMFCGCNSLSSVDVSGFDTSNVTDMEDMFSYCDNLTIINSPYNVAVTALLPSVPGTAWHLPDGTEVTELPPGLSYSVTLTRSDTPTTPQITTTTTDLNMADVVRVKYVPYSYTVETNNNDSENTVTFSIEEGRLADGLEMYPATGEIYGVPLEAGEFKIRVKVTYSNPAYPPAYAELTLIVLDNTDDNVGVATDLGYDITQPVADFDMGAVAGSGTQTLVSQGEYSQFRDVYIDGQKLAKGQEYTAEAGSTRITILNQTLANGGEGTHTLGVEFRTEDGTLKRAAQNYTISSGTENTPGNGNNKPSVEPPVNNGSNNDNSNNNSYNSSNDNDNNSNILPVAENPQQDFIVYTVQRGDSLWKIAIKFYGQGRSWRRIYEDNAAVIRNPGRLYAGQRLVIRLTETIAANNVSEYSSSTGVLEGTIYKVQRGDSLWTIARRVYGSGRLWNIIYEANRDIIADPDRIRGSQVLAIPQR